VELKGWQERKLSLEYRIKKKARLRLRFFLSAGAIKSNGTNAY
jgi:hypothetical protein